MYLHSVTIACPFFYLFFQNILRKDSCALIFLSIIYEAFGKEKKNISRYPIYEQVGRICSPLYCWWSMLREEVTVAVYRRMFSTCLLARC